MDRDHIFKNKTSIAKNQPCGVEKAKWKIHSQAQFQVKDFQKSFTQVTVTQRLPKTVLWEVLTPPLFAGGFWKPLGKAVVFCLSH